MCRSTWATSLRPALSCLDFLYAFVDRPFAPEHLRELRVIKGLLILAEPRLGRRWCPLAFLSDTSRKGFCLAEGAFDLASLAEAGKHSERWRFKARVVTPDIPGPYHRAVGAEYQKPLVLLAEEGPNAPAARSRHERPRVKRIVELVEDDTPLPPIPKVFSEGARWVEVFRGA